MADITKFVNAALDQGETFDVYLNRFPKIGSGRANTLEPLHANLTVDASILGHSIQGDIDIVMPDLSPSGTCQISFLGSAQQGSYTTNGGKLEISVSNRTLTFYAGDKEWSWIDVSGVPGSIGVWPTSKVLHDDAEQDLAATAA
jgi:hypothetical protein